MLTTNKVLKTAQVGGLAGLSTASIADEFTEADVKRWQQQFMDTVKQGRELWTSPKSAAMAWFVPSVIRMLPIPTQKPIRNSKSNWARLFRFGK